MIAMAMSCWPRLLIADEPTTALDVTIQAQVLELITEMQDEFHMAVIFITHDLGVVAQVCDRVAVMYAGRIVEEAPIHDLYARPAHPYTEGLLNSMPLSGPRTARLVSIPGSTPVPSGLPPGCAFAPRCPYAIDACRSGEIPLLPIRERHTARCIRASELSLKGAT
jgi:oligopeptide/dipeptide ABC transporter ATP-binding protein